jgi:hypothetical protein
MKKRGVATKNNSLIVLHLLVILINISKNINKIYNIKYLVY